MPNYAACLIFELYRDPASGAYSVQVRISTPSHLPSPRRRLDGPTGGVPAQLRQHHLDARPRRRLSPRRALPLQPVQTVRSVLLSSPYAVLSTKTRRVGAASASFPWTGPRSAGWRSRCSRPLPLPPPTHISSPTSVCPATLPTILLSSALGFSQMQQWGWERSRASSCSSSSSLASSACVNARNEVEFDLPSFTEKVNVLA